MTTVAITGATGFVGSAVARALAARGANIIALVRSTSNKQVLSDLDVTWVEGDITQPESLDGAFNGAEWIIHAAGILGRANVSEDTYRRVHVDGTNNVLAEAEKASRILIVSSPGVLGPITGSAADETAPLAPSNPYERSKAEAEEVALSYAQRGRPVVIARPEFIYGPGDMHVLGLFRAIKRGIFFYVGGGKNLCHPTFIEDAVEGLILCLKNGNPGEVYHIAGPGPVTFRELGDTIAHGLGVRTPWLSLPSSIAWFGATLAELAGQILSKEPPLSRSGVAFFSENRLFSWDKANKVLGYTPKYHLADGVQRTVTWYRTQSLL